MLTDVMNGALTSLDDLLWRVRQFFCRHDMWIPAIYDKQGAKLCATCGKKVVMSDEEFYAEFGSTVNHVLASRHRS